MSGESKVDYYVVDDLFGSMTEVVTHADYKALEDECERLRARVGELVDAVKEDLFYTDTAHKKTRLVTTCES